MKRVAVMQPYFFPYVGYFQLINAADDFVIFDDVNFIKRGWINRNNILINGDKKLFSVSVHGASSNKLINELEIADDFAKFLKMIEISYSKAPYFKQTFNMVKNICDYSDKNLAKFIGNSLVKISEYLNLDTIFLYSSEVRKDETLKGQDKIIAICKELEATDYINLMGGIDLYDNNKFKEEDLNLKFLKPQVEEYKQFGQGFIPSLSIIDLLMFNTPEKAKEMLASYELL